MWRYKWHPVGNMADCYCQEKNATLWQLIFLSNKIAGSNRRKKLSCQSLNNFNYSTGCHKYVPFEPSF